MRRQSLLSQNSALAAAITRVHGAKGGKGGAGSNPPVESPNTLQSRNIARIIEVLSEGEIEGPGVDGNWEKSIQLDKGTPIRSAAGVLNFSGITVATRLGLPDQTYLEGFPAVESPVSVATEVLQATPLVRRITAPNPGMMTGPDFDFEAIYGEFRHRK